MKNHEYLTNLDVSAHVSWCSEGSDQHVLKSLSSKKKTSIVFIYV
uniref:Uncharacterized protein n=1 Tax=Anguilla anguilla TaxID=7936 RepID=A0A0E9W2G0_ANGAN